MNLKKYPNKFYILLSVATLIGAAIRIIYIVHYQWHIGLYGDDYYFHWQGWMIANGLGVSDPFVYFGKVTGPTVPTLAFSHISGRVVPGAYHPPLLSFVVAGMDLIGISSSGSQIITLGIITSFEIIFIGLAIREISSAKVGVIGAFIAAIYPPMWIFSGRLLAESLAQLLVSIFVLATFKYYNKPSFKYSLFLGIDLSFCILSRSETVLLLLVPPFLLFMATRNEKVGNQENVNSTQRIIHLKFFLSRLIPLILFPLIIVGPWVARNMVVFKYSEYLSADFGIVLGGSNCANVYSGPETGYNDFGCNQIPSNISDDSVVDHVNLIKGEDYIRGHKATAIYVGLVRVARVYYLYNPKQQSEAIGEGISSWPAIATISSWISSYPLELLALLGMISMRRRKIPISPLLGLIIASTLAVFVSYGDIRFTAIAEVSYVIAGSLGVDLILSKLQKNKSIASSSVE